MIEVAAWNLQGRLGQPEHQVVVFEQLRRQASEHAGVIVLSEVCREKPLPVDEVRGKLAEFAKHEGYNLHWTAYDDMNKRPGMPDNYNQYLAVLNRLDNYEASVLRLSGRKAIAVTTLQGDQHVTITGAHFDDRSEYERILQAFSYGDIAAEQGSDRDILAGDLNSMHSSSARALVLRAIHMVGERQGLKADHPSELGVRTAAEKAQYKLRRAESLLMRAGEMAYGIPLEILSDYGYLDADPQHKPTHLIGQLDHIMYSPGVERIEFRRGNKEPSDHRLISAKFDF